MVVVNPNNGPLGGASNANIYVTGYSYGDVVTIKYTQPTVVSPAVSPEVVSIAEETGIQKFNINHYPNPVNSFTNIGYNLPVNGRVTIDVYDAAGKKISTLVDGYRSAGRHTTRFDATGLANGLYSYQCIAQCGSTVFRETKTMIIQR